MSIEIERRFRVFDSRALPKKSTAEYMFEIVVMKPTKAGQTIRLRKEGDINTFTIKQKTDSAYPIEWETTVGSIEMAENMLAELGVVHDYNLQKHRTVYKLKSVEIAIDEFPGLPPYMEIEGETEEAVKEAAAAMGANWNESDFTASTLYNELYGITMDKKVRPNDDLNFITAYDKMLPYFSDAAAATAFHERLMEQQVKYGFVAGAAAAAAAAKKTMKRNRKRQRTRKMK